MSISPSATPAELLAAMPYAQALGIRLGTFTPELVTGELDWAPERCTAGGILHGGAVMSLADTVGAVCSVLNLPPGAGTATIESKTNLFRPARSGTLHASARPLHVGRSFIVIQTSLADDTGRPVARPPRPRPCSPRADRSRAGPVDRSA